MVIPGDLHTGVWKQKAEIAFEDKGFCEWTPHPGRTPFITSPVAQAVACPSEAWVLSCSINSSVGGTPLSVPPWPGNTSWPPRAALSDLIWNASSPSSTEPKDCVLPMSWPTFLQKHIISDFVLCQNMSSPEAETVLVFVGLRKNKSTWSLVSSQMIEQMNT